MRKAIFDILGSGIKDKLVLDLYCGSGALGFEAISMGCAGVVFVDTSPGCARAVRKTLSRILQTGFKGVAANARVIQSDADRALKRLRRLGLKFEVVLADPPYGKGMAARCLKNLLCCGICKPEAVVVVEESSKVDMPGEVRGENCSGMFLLKIAAKVYGDTKVWIYRALEESHGDLPGDI